MSEELKPCPFCGNKPGQQNEDGFSRTGMWHIIFCNSCDVRVEVGMATLKDAIDTWNTRADGWINVDDRLPQLGTWVFISDGAGTHFSAFVNHLGFVGADGEAFDSSVTHWMPLPDPPEAKP